MADGSSFGIDLGVTGGDQAVSAAAAMDALAEKLTIAGAAATAASDAQKAGQAAYNQAETAANRAALAVEKIGLAAEAQRGKAAAVAEEFGLFSPQFQKASDKLGALTARQAEAVTKSAAAAAAMNAEASALDKLKASATAADAAEAKLNKEHADAASAAKDAAKNTKSAGDAAEGGALNFRALSSGLGKLGGPLGSIGSQAAGVGGALQKLSGALGSAGPYVAAAVLAVALATAFAAAALAITHFAVVNADAARTQALLSDGIAGSVAGGRQLDATFASLANKVPLSRDELAGMASELSKSGLKGDALSSALETAAVKAAKLKFGPDFAKQMLSLDNQSAKLKSSVTSLFSGLKIEGLLEGLSKLVALFDENSASGKAIKVVFESLFQPIVDGLTGLLPKIVSTFLQLEIWALKAMIAIKPFGTDIEYIGIAFGILAVVCVAAIVIIIAICLALVAIPVLIVAAYLWVQDNLLAVFNAIGAACKDAFNSVSAAIGSAIDFIKGLSLSQIGSDLIDGLVSGITSAGPKVLTAITGLASGAITAAKKALGIASPSTVFAEIGMHTAAGMEQGVDGGADAVQGSMVAMVAPPDAAAGGGGGPAPAAKGGALSAGMFAGATFIFQGVGGDAKSFAEEFRDHLEDLLSTAQGGAPHAA